jgi:hypothetical protein
MLFEILSGVVLVAVLVTVLSVATISVLEEIERSAANENSRRRASQSRI